MAEDKLEKRTELSANVKTSILEAIQATIAREKELTPSRLGGIADVVRALDDIDLYGKNSPGDGYAKNTTKPSLGDIVTQPALTAVELERLTKEAKR